MLTFFRYKIIKERLSFVPDISLSPSISAFCSVFSVFSTKSPAVPLHFMESRERCFLPVLLYTGPASPLRKAGAGRHCSALIACQYTHRSEKSQPGKDEKATKRRSNPGPANSHTESALAPKTSNQMKNHRKHTLNPLISLYSF